MKTLVDRSAFELISDDCPDVLNFCIVMEHIFTHRIQCWCIIKPQFCLYVIVLLAFNVVILLLHLCV